MKLENINTVYSNVRVLVAPLDWGLGHATRCIPIIYELIRLHFDVLIAAEGKQKNYYKRVSQPGFSAFLRGYEVRYSKNKWLLFFSLFTQLPKLFRRIY